jgi:hypothetical protein
LIVLALVYMNQNSFNITTNYLTSNDLSSQMTTVFAPATSTLWVIQFRYALVAFLIASMIVPGLYIYWIQSGKKKIDFHKARWLDCVLTSAFIILVVTLLSSLEDFMTLVLIAGLVVVGSSLFWIATHQYSINKSIYNKTFFLGIISIVLPWLLIALYTSGTWVYGDIRSPWFTYALAFVGVINTAFLIYGPLWHQARQTKKEALTTEAFPIIINQLVKLVFCVIMIIGMR